MKKQSLTQKIKSAQIQSFGDPIHYYGEYYPNNIRVIKKSDFDFFEPYINARREQETDSEFYKEMSRLEGADFNRVFIFDGSYSHTVPDDVILSPELLYKFFFERGIIVGPELNDDAIHYLNYDGDISDRLDIFGKPVTSAGYKFLCNSIWLNETKYQYRTFRLKTGDDSLTVFCFPNILKAYMLAAYEDEEYADDFDAVEKFFDDGQLIDEVVFVKNLDSNKEITEKIEQKFDILSELFEDKEGEFSLKEWEYNPFIKCENSIDIKI